MDGLNSRAFDEQNESATFRETSAFGSFRRSVSRVCVAFVAYLSCPFRATDVRGWPYTLGGALRLRRVALPWANLFCPFGVERFLDAWPVSALVVLRVPAAAPSPTLLPAAFVYRGCIPKLRMRKPCKKGVKRCSMSWLHLCNSSDGASSAIPCGRRSGIMP